MDNYTLKADETILYRGSVVVLRDGKSNEKKDHESDILLTNLNIVIVTTTKKILRTVAETFTYRVKDVKIYDESVQVKRKKSIVDIYLKDCELFLDFKKESEAKDFCGKALRLISGESKFVRSVKKAKKTVNETNEALDIDIGDMTKKTVLFTAEVTTGIASLKGVGRTTQVFGKIAESVLKKSKRKETKALEAPKENEHEEEEENSKTEYVTE